MKLSLAFLWNFLRFYQWEYVGEPGVEGPESPTEHHTHTCQHLSTCAYACSHLLSWLTPAVPAHTCPHLPAPTVPAHTCSHLPASVHTCYTYL